MPPRIEIDGARRPRLFRRKRDIILLASVVPPLIAAVGYGLYDLHQLRESLRARGEAHLDEWFSGANVNRDDFHTLVITDTYKSFTLFGQGRGTVHIYSVHKDDPDFESFSGVEYHYVRGPDGWELTDSAGCTALAHHQRAIDAFANAGIRVPDRLKQDAGDHAHGHPDAPPATEH